MTDYYCSAAGSGSGAGTELDPFLTIAEVNAGVGANDTVYFRRGDTFNDATLNGNAANMTFDAYGTGALPIIDGVLARRACYVTSAGCVINNLHFQNGDTQTLRIGSGANGVMTLSNVEITTTQASGFYFDGSGQLTATNITVNHGTATSSAYGFICFPATTCNLTLANINVRANGAHTMTRPSYFRAQAGTFTGTITNLNLDGAKCTLPTEQIMFQHNGTLTFDGLTANNTVGKITIGAAGQTPVCTINDLVFPDCSDTAVHCPAAGVTLTLKNPQIDRAASVGVLAVSPVKLSIFGADGHIRNCGNIGLQITTSGVLECHDIDITDNAQFGVRADGTTTTSFYGVTAARNAQDGFNWTGSGTHYTEGCVADSNGTTSIGASGDGFSAHDTCTINNIGCLSVNNLGGGFSHINTTQGSIKNCTTYGNNKVAGSSQDNDVAGIRWQTTSTIEIVDNILMNDDYALYIDGGTVAGATMTIDRNLYYNTNTYPTESGNSLPFLWGSTDYNYADWVTQSGETGSINADPEFVDTTSFELAISSPAIGSSDQNWTPSAPRPAGVNGEPYPDRSIDKGGNQSQHSCGHTTKVRNSGTCI